MDEPEIMPEKVLNLIPQQRPFRFIDEILKMGDDEIAGTYRFSPDEYFYSGHFPEYPVTPGVILIETMAQTGVVAFGIYLLLRQGIDADTIKKMKTLFAMADNVEFLAPVHPGERVIVRGRKVYFRRGNLKTTVILEKEDGHLACSGILTGKGVNFDEP
ncbi:MAG: hotdog domain-containing protein [Syntrophales bacterium]|jgi:3-hydroxyacyl-[acyl-carrier-protein] dehydratase|nr:hotdog domain-containing protein [Syntrophales bacterium]